MMKELSDRFQYYSGILASVYPAAVQDLKRVMNLLEAEEKGLLVKLPCKVGDMVYLTNHDRTAWRKRPLICVIDEFTMSDNNYYAVLNANEPFYAMHRFKAVDIKEFGKTVFLTKEEALRKLKELENV